MIRAIAAIDDQRGIAKDGSIPWRIPEDSAYWKQQTMSGANIMGRLTYEAMRQPLAQRRNVVVSKHLKSVRPGFERITDVEPFVADNKADVWIIGGAELYAAALPYCDELYLTRVAGSYNCDRFFPAFAADFELIDQTKQKVWQHYQYQFTIWRRT